MLLADTKGYHLHVFIVCIMKNLPAEKCSSYMPRFVLEKHQWH